MLPALVLTAGLGTRLDPLTRLVAKGAVPIVGRTLVERVLEWLRREGVTDAVLNLHHLPHTITRIVGDGRHLGVRVRYSWEQPLLGSAGGPRHALPLLDADLLLIVNGDTLSDFAFEPMIEAHHRTKADVTVAVVPNPAPEHYNGILIDGEDRVTGFVPKGHASGSWHFIGVQVARASVFAPLPDGVPAETIAGIYRERVTSAPGSLRAWRASTTFLDVGTPRDYLEAVVRVAANRATHGVIEAGAQVDPTARLARSVVWSGARIEAGVALEECIVAGNLIVPPRFEASGKVIVPASVARADDRAEIRDGMMVADLGPRQ